MGLPIPAVPTLIVAGALVVDGKLSGFAVLGAAMLACAIADSCWYLAGRRYGNGVMKTLCRISLSPDSCVRQTEARFERWGASLLLFAKFVPLVAMIASPLAGAAVSATVERESVNANRNPSPPRPGESGAGRCAGRGTNRV